MTKEEAIEMLEDLDGYFYDNRGRDYDEAFRMAIESLSAEPTVIRSKTLMPTKDFKEWAKRVREENPNAIIIPCDAEVVSAESTLQTPQTYGKSINPSNAEVVADLISRADAVRVVEQIFPFSAEMANAKCGCITQLNLLPSADRPSGDWVKQNAELKISDYRCSECGHYQDDKTDFCPNCGAKMGGE